jgi:hypothetical protein
MGTSTTVARFEVESDANGTVFALKNWGGPAGNGFRWVEYALNPQRDGLTRLDGLHEPTAPRTIYVRHLSFPRFKSD